MVNNTAQLDDELDCFFFSSAAAMDPTNFYGALSESASVPAYSMRPRPVRPAEQGGSLSATRSGGDLRRSQRETKPRFYEETAEDVRRSGRERKTRVLSGVTPLTGSADPVPRKRTLSISALQNGAHVAQSAAKKQKMDEKKAQTVVVNERRDARDKARKKWLLHHESLFSPLLPSSSAFFETLKNEVARFDSKFIVPFHELDEQPSSINEATLKDYQLSGLSFLVWMYKNGMNCILGDEMGLGKTLQTLSLFAWIKENETGAYDPQLVICPLSVLQSWENEAARWLPSLSTMRFHGVINERNRLKDALRRGEIEQPHVIFTTYETFVAEDSWFKSQRWTYCVLDEGHKIKNADTNIAGKLQGLGCLYRLILTGTPIQNNLVELWSLLHWLYPSVFTDASEHLFKHSFDMSKGSYDMSFLNAAKELVSKIMLRRTKGSVEISVPPREEMTIFVPLTEAQRFWTYRLLTRMDTSDLREIFLQGSKIKVEDRAVHEGRQEVLSMLEDQMKQERVLQNGRYKKLMNLLLQLRKVCDHPYMLPNAPPEPYILGEHIVAASSKLIAIDKLLADILPQGERVLIFSQWTMMLDYLEDFLALRSIKYARLDGSTYRPRRRLDIRLFQMDKSPYQVFLISTRAGGLGINLTKASHVIMCDSDWNPQNDLQAIARAHRIGQTKTVKVYRLICQGSVEDQMLDRIRRKLFLSVKIMGSNNSSSENASLDSSELLDILRKGSSALMRTDHGMDLSRFLDASVADILQASKKIEERRDVIFKRDVKKEECTDNDAKLLEDAEEEQRRLLKGVAQVQSRFFEGRVIQRQTNSEIANEWKDLQRGASVDQEVSVDGMAFTISSESTPEVVVEKPVKRERIKYESEEWCNYCRDGGELVLCNLCPRVFHLQCHGISKAALARMINVACSQHACSVCARSTGDAGGMLFRCQTCHQAFCEDCLPFDDIEPVGEALPEFELLGYPVRTNAYYIRCHDCLSEFRQTPSIWESWQEEFRQVQQKLEKKLLLN